jgi:hypothetical protein
VKFRFYISLCFLVFILCGCGQWERDWQGTLQDNPESNLQPTQVYKAYLDAPSAVVFRDVNSGTLIFYHNDERENTSFRVVAEDNDGTLIAEAGRQKYFLKLRHNSDGSVSVKDLASKAWVRYRKL